MQLRQPEKLHAPKSQKSVPLDPVGHNIATFAELRAQAEQQVDRHQRNAEKITEWLGRSLFLYLLIFVMSIWVIINLMAHLFGLRPFDPPPFNLLISVINVIAVLISSVVLISQNRQGKLAERREHLDLQINMLNDQRTAKIIALLEELRQDMPTVKNRVDLEAEALAETINPKDVLDALETSLEQAIENAAKSIKAVEAVEETIGNVMQEAVMQEEQKQEDQKQEKQKVEEQKVEEALQKH